MKVLKDPSEEESAALWTGLRAASYFPIKGVHVGSGLHCAMPDSINDSDVLSRDQDLTVGWTHWGPSINGHPIPLVFIELTGKPEFDELDIPPNIRGIIRSAVARAKDPEQ